MGATKKGKKEEFSRVRRERNSGGLFQKSGKWLDKTSGDEVFYTYWQATKDIPLEDLPDGVERKRITGNGKTRSEAQRRLDANVRKFYSTPRTDKTVRRRGRRVPVKSVSEWFAEWHEGLYADDVSLTVRTRYAQYFQSHIEPHIGNIALTDLTGDDVKRLFHQTLVEKKKVRNGVETDEPLLGPASRLNILKTLNNCMNGAVSSGLISINPVNQVRRPKTQKPEGSREVSSNGARMKRLFGGELDRKEYPYFAQFLFQFLGLRQSERLGLTWDNVRDLHGTLFGASDGSPHLIINQQIDRHIDGGGWFLKSGTKSGEPREIPLFEPFLTVLREHKERMDQYKKSPSWRPPKMFERSVFLHPDGSPITPRQDTREWHKLLSDHNIPYFRGHQTRHITATWLADDPSISMTVVRAIIGHDSEAMGHYYARTTALQVEQGMLGFGDRVFPKLSLETKGESLEARTSDTHDSDAKLEKKVELASEQYERDALDQVMKLCVKNGLDWETFISSIKQLIEDNSYGEEEAPEQLLRLWIDSGLKRKDAPELIERIWKDSHI